MYTNEAVKQNIKNTIDKFYTKNSTVQFCLKYMKKHITFDKNDLLIEPSAGNGAFINAIKQLSNNYRNPVLIRGFVKDKEAVKKWDIDYLENILNDFNLEILKKEENNLLVKNYSFSEFVKKVKSENIYINNNNTIFYKFPDIFNDIKD